MGLMTAEISQIEKGGKYDPYLEKKYPNALAKLLLIQLNKFDETLSHRGIINTLYEKTLHATLRQSSGQARSALYATRFPLLIKNKIAVLKRLSAQNIFLGDWYSQPVAPKELRLERVGYTMGSCPVAEQINKEIINLPTLISIKDAQKIIKVIS